MEEYESMVDRAALPHEPISALHFAPCVTATPLLNFAKITLLLLPLQLGLVLHLALCRRQRVWCNSSGSA